MHSNRNWFTAATLTLAAAVMSVALPTFAREPVVGPQLYKGPDPDTQPWRIVPHPKHVTWSKAMAAIPLNGVIRTTSPKVGKLLADEVRRLRPHASLTVTQINAEQPTLIWTISKASADQVVLTDIASKLPDHREGYAIKVGEDGAAAVARDGAGLLNAAHTLLCVMDQVKEDNRWPELTVRDWPALGFRGFFIPLRNTSAWLSGAKAQSPDAGIKLYKTMLRRLGRYKYNYVVIYPVANIKLKSHPDLWSGFYSRDEIKELLAFGRRRGLTPVPQISTMSGFFKGNPHRKALVKKFHDLFEPHMPKGERNKGVEMRAVKETFKLADPRVLELMKDVIADVYELFGRPPYVHIDGDELTYVGNSLPADADRGRLLADYANELDDFVTHQLGARTMMWDDMLLTKEEFPNFYHEDHGGPPYNTADALKRLNRDIILTAWHYGWPIENKVPQTYPMVTMFQGKGFDVIGVTWFRQDNIVNFSRQILHDHAMGVMGTSFSMHRSYTYATGGWMNDKAKKTAKAREELGVMAATAEGAWSPRTAAQTLGSYSPYRWELERLGLKVPE